MNKEGIIRILKEAKRINPEMILLATRAYHRLGDVSRKKLDLCFVSGETEKFFIGCWYKHSFLTDVIFPKKTTRKIASAEEAKKYLDCYHINIKNLSYFDFLCHRE